MEFDRDNQDYQLSENAQYWKKPEPVPILAQGITSVGRPANTSFGSRCQPTLTSDSCVKGITNGMETVSPGGFSGRKSVFRFRERTGKQGFRGRLMDS